MKIFSGKMRLSGDANYEIPLVSIPAAEVHILRRLHGDDSVVILREDGADSRSDRHWRAYLQRKFSPAAVEKFFGASHVPLPDGLPEDVAIGGVVPAAASEDMFYEETPQFTPKPKAVPQKTVAA